MSTYKNLVKVFITALSMGNPDKKKKRIFYKLAGFIIVSIVMIPCAVLVGAIVYGITSALRQLGGNIEGISLILYLITIFSVIFGINVIFSVLYFSSDTEYLLPLPIKPSVLSAAKFTAAFLGENIMQVVIVLGAFIGYFLAMGFSVTNCIFAIAGVFTLPLLPMAYCGIISILVMSFSSIFKNKKAVNKLTTVLLLAVIVMIIVGLSSLRNVELDEYILNFAKGNNSLSNILNIIFPTVLLLTNSISNVSITSSIISFVLYLLVNIIAVSIFIILGHFLYLKGLVGINVQKTSNNKKDINKVINSSKVRTQKLSYFRKEITILFKTQAFLMNCILINIIWPVFLYIIVMLQGKTNFLEGFINSYKNNTNNTHLWVLIGVVLIALLVTALNSLGSSAITREGKNIFFMKYIPVPYMTQINVKAFISIMISFIGVFIYIVISSIYLDAGILNTLLYCLVSLCAIIFVTYLGIYLDSVNPKLTWDDELSALRENYNIFFNMGFSMIFTLALCGAICLLYFLCNIPVIALSISSLIILLICDIIVYNITKVKAVKNIIELNC